MNFVIEHQFQSAAFPLIGAGTGGGSDEKVLSMMEDELAQIDYDGRIVIGCFR